MHLKRAALLANLLFGWSSPLQAATPTPQVDVLLSAHVLPQSVKVGENAQAQVTFQPIPPWTLHRSTPFAVTVTTTAGLEANQNKLSATDIRDVTATDKAVSVGLTARALGPQTTTLRLNFFLCTDEVCQRHNETLVVRLEVF